MPTTGLWQVDIVHVKPEYFFEYIKHISKGVELQKKHGATPINQYFTEAGGAPEVIYITKYENFEQRAKIVEGYMKDTEFQNLFKETAKCVLRVQNYVCMANPQFGVTHPSSAKTKRMFEMIKVKDPIHYGQKIKDMVSFWQNKIGESDAARPLILLQPIFFTQQCVILIMEVPENLDTAFAKYGEALHDARNWHVLAEAGKTLDVQSLRLLTPVSTLSQ